MHRSRLDMRGADAGAGGMSISSGSGSGGGASGMGASSSSDSSAMAHIGGPSSAGSGTMCLGEELIVGVERRGLFDCIAGKTPVAMSAQATPTSRPHLVGVQEVLHCAGCPFGRRLAPPCFVHGQVFEGAVEDGAGKSGARLRLDAALEAAEDGHVAGLQIRRALRREKCESTT